MSQEKDIRVGNIKEFLRNASTKPLKYLARLYGCESIGKVFLRKVKSKHESSICRKDEIFHSFVICVKQFKN